MIGGPVLRLLLATGLLAAAAGAAGLSAATMTDHVAGRDTAIKAGTLNLSADHAGSSVLDGSALRPGLRRDGIVDLHNSGDVEATASLSVTDVTDAPVAAGLSAVLELQVDDCGTDADCGTPRPVYDGGLRALDRAVELGALPAGGHRFVRLALAWGPTKDDPSRQGAATRATLTWTAIAGDSA
jgi:hypothetical protein